MVKFVHFQDRGFDKIFSTLITILCLFCRGFFHMWVNMWLTWEDGFGNIFSQSLQFSFKKWLRPTAAKFVHLQDRGCDKIFSTPITIYGFSPVWVNMCLTWEVGFGNIYSQNSQFSLWKWLRPSVAKFMNLQHSGCDKIFFAFITMLTFVRLFSPTH